MENLLLILFGAFLGGLISFLYFNFFYLKDSISKKISLPKLEHIFFDTSPKDAKNTIISLYKALNDPTTDAKSLVRKSYALYFEDFYKIIFEYKLIEFLKDPKYKKDLLYIRAYPILKKDQIGDYLSLIFMVEKEGELIWKSSQDISIPQFEIQDQVFPCPINCPPLNDFFTKEDWEKVLLGQMSEF